MEKKVVVIKFVTGEEIIGMMGPQSIVSSQVSIEFPLVTQLMKDGVGFMPFMPAAKTESVVFDQRVILAGPLEPQKEMEAQYLQIVGEILADLEEKAAPIAVLAAKKIII